MKSQEITEFIENLINAEMSPQKEYILNSFSYRDVFQYASGLYESFLLIKNFDNPVCICTEKKGIIMAACIAALCSGQKLLFPYAFSKQVIKEARENLYFNYVIADSEDKPVDGVNVIIPEKRSIEELNIKNHIGENDVFINLFTGGSTGTPKIWPKSPKNIFSEVSYLSNHFNIKNDDCIIATVPPYHIYGLLFSVLIPFVSHSTVLNDIYTFPQEIISTAIDNRATILVSVPMHYRVLRNSDFSGHGLRLAFSSAGALEEKDAEAFCSRTGIGVNEVYGSTETGGIASRCRAEGDEDYQAFRAVAWKSDDELLYVNSDFISKNLSVDSEGFFKTSDRVLKINDSKFRLLGRSDGVVKVGGKRVDLVDVQSKLKLIEGVKDAYVLSVKGRSGRENEIAALVQGSLDEKKIRRNLSFLLEPYAVPRRIKVVENIPVLSTGKYNRNEIEKFFI